MLGVSSRQHREVVAGFEIRRAVEGLGGRDTGFSQAIILDEFLQTWRLATGIGNQPVFQQPANPARIVVS